MLPNLAGIRHGELNKVTLVAHSRKLGRKSDLSFVRIIVTKDKSRLREKFGCIKTSFPCIILREFLGFASIVFVLDRRIG